MIGLPRSLYLHAIFLWCGEKQIPNTKYLELIKRRSKVQENNIPCERTLNFEKWKTFSENYKPMRVWLQNLQRIIGPDDFSPNSFKLLFSKFIQTQKRYPNLETTGHIKLKFFLWTKLLENFPVDTRHRFNVYKMSIRRRLRRIDVL